MRFQVERLIIADPSPWTPTLRVLVEQTRAAGIRIESGTEHIEVDGVQLAVASDARTGLVRSRRAVLAVVPPDSDWRGYPKPVPAAIFTRGGPAIGFRASAVNQPRRAVPARSTITEGQ